MPHQADGFPDIKDASYLGFKSISTPLEATIAAISGETKAGRLEVRRAQLLELLQVPDLAWSIFPRRRLIAPDLPETAVAGRLRWLFGCGRGRRLRGGRG